MDGLRYRSIGIGIACGLLLCVTATTRGDDLPEGYNRPIKESSIEFTGASPSVNDWDLVVRHLSSEWEEISDELRRCMLEATMSMMIIRASPKPGPLPAQGEPKPPEGNGEPPPPPPPPPPPEGSSEEPVIDPPPPPPNDTPEPASIVTAMVGLGVMGLVAWRRRARLAANV